MVRGNRNNRPSGGTASVWLISFTDLVCLMLAFFVMLFAMSNPVAEKWEKVTSALSTSLSPQEERVREPPKAVFNISSIDETPGVNLDYLAGLLEQQLAADGQFDAVTLTRLSDRLVITLSSDLLFQTGQADVTARGQQTLFTLGGALSRLRNQVEVAGHTDPQPINGGIYPSNWELSLARALSVAAALREAGYDRDVLVQGFADSHYGQLPVDLSQEERDRLARRVDIAVRAFKER